MKNLRIVPVLAITLLLFGCGEKELENEILEKRKSKEGLVERLNELKDSIATIDEWLAENDPEVIDQRPIVIFDTIQKGKFEHYIEIQGRIDSDKNLVVAGKNSGTITRVYVKNGQFVKKGQTLATLESDILYRNLDELTTQIALADSVYRRQEALWEQKIGTEMQYLQAKSQLESLQKRKATLKEQIATTVISAPIAGYIDDVMKNEGELMAPGMPIFRLVNYSEYKVVAEVAESYAAKVKRGDLIKVYLPDLKQEFDTRIGVVGGIIDPLNRTFDVEVRMRQKSTSIKPNMIAYVRIKDYDNKAAIAVNINSVLDSKDGKYVYVAESKDGKWYAKKKIVKTGVAYKGLIEVTEGLAEGDKLITVGHLDLLDGTEVRF